MPQQQQPNQLPEVDLEQIPFMYPGQKQSDATAVSLVKKTFGRYEALRHTQERRWDIAARLYHGALDERNWEGTNVKRANLAVPIVYDQIESAFPIICDALFTYWPTFFDVTPLPGSTTQEATQIKEVLSAYMETPFDESCLTAIAHIKMALKQAKKFGDGCIEVSWDAVKKRPIVEWKDTRDVYLEPTALGPSPDWSPAFIDRALMTVEDLAALRGTPGVNIPPDPVLNALAKARYITMGDISKQREAAARKEVYYVSDLRTDPAHQLVEVLKYWTKDKLIWTLGRLWCAINEKNPYGFIPYCRVPYTLIEGRPYSMALADVLEGEQKYAQGIRNARIDNLSLALNPPRIRAAGAPTTPSSTAWRPGLEDRVSDPKNVEVAKIENITADAYKEEEVIQQAASKRTGINDMVQSGVPTPSNANRSATGVSTQSRSVSTRLSTAVSNAEEYMIVPLLYKMQKMIAKFAPEQFQVVNSQQQTVSAQKNVFGKDFTFRIDAANRMITKDKLSMFLGPVSQMLFNETVMHQANLQNKTVDFQEWLRFFQDATGTTHAYSFFRDMTQQEAQIANQPDPNVMAQIQQKQQELQTRQQIASNKNQVESEKNHLEFQAKAGETGEESARRILAILQADRNDKAAGGGAKGSGGSSPTPIAPTPGAGQIDSTYLGQIYRLLNNVKSYER